MLKHLVRISIPSAAVALFLVPVADAGEYSVQAISASYTNPSNPNVSCPIVFHDSVALTVNADGTVANSNSQATITFEVRYTPDVGEINLPTTAYVAADFVNFFGSTSSTDEAYVCDITNGHTKVDQADRAIFADSNYASVIFGQQVQSTPLANVDGVLVGTVSFQTNKVRAAISATGNVATATQHVSIDTVSSQPISTGARQMLNGEDRAVIKFLSGLPVSTYVPPYTYHGWTLGKSDYASFSAGAFFWGREVVGSGSTDPRADAPLPQDYGYVSNIAFLTYKVTLRKTSGASELVYPLVRKTSSDWAVLAVADNVDGTVGFIQGVAGSAQATASEADHYELIVNSKSNKLTQNITLTRVKAGVYSSTGTWTSVAWNVLINGQPGKNDDGLLAQLSCVSAWQTKLLLK